MGLEAPAHLCSLANSLKLKEKKKEQTERVSFIHPDVRKYVHTKTAALENVMETVI